MKNLKLAALFVLVLSAVLVSGCAFNVKHMYTPQISVHAPGSGQVDLLKVQEAVMDACSACGWNIDRKTDSVIRATYRFKGVHSATVDIAYNTGSITIQYVASEAMKYSDGSGGRKIHRGYNNWVKELESAIRRNLARTL
ncbi:MAG: hypothetical protein Q4F72_05440 [Desulfovibrionaceae bacterium]|nr:hypothetical protein [Desulfovibrionaceae bacterium]